MAEKLIHELCRSGLVIQWAASDVDALPAPWPGLRALPMSASNFTERRLGFPYPVWGPRSLLRLFQAVHDADVVHLHDSLYFGNLCAFVIAKVKCKPVLVTQHIGEIPYRSRLLKTLMKTANRLVGRVVLSRADQVVFIADQIRRFFEGRFKFRTPPALVMNGVDAATFSAESAPADRAEARNTLGLDAHRPVFLFVGRFVEKKGIPLLRSIAASLPQVQWVFAGWGPLDPGAWKLPQVRVAGRCSADELRQLYVAADVLVLPSVGEGFPLVVQESMACGTPAIVSTETASACPAAGDLILHEDVSGVSALDGWTRRLEALASGPTLETMRPAVAGFARDHWSWARAASAYEQHYRRLVVNAASSPENS